VVDDWTPTNGRTPKTGEAKLFVRFRCGYEDLKNEYKASQIRWTNTGDDWDAVAVKRA